MKKAISILCVVVAMLLMMTACGKPVSTDSTTVPSSTAADTSLPDTTVADVPADTTAPVDDEHQHQASQWAFDTENHWFLCECGQTVMEEHQPDEWGYCEICRVSVCFNQDGSYSILTYDEYGSMSSETNYDAEGNVIYAIEFKLEYFDDGNPSHTWEYQNGVLIRETVYQRSENNAYAEVYISEDITYFDDGNKSVTCYDEHWNMLSSTIYGQNDEIITQEVWEYAYDENGNLTGTKTFKNDKLIAESESMTGPDGQTYEIKHVGYDDNGKVIVQADYVYEFAETGDPSHVTAYDFGVKVHETFYENISEGRYYLCRQVSYDKNGNITEEYFYDEQGDMIKG